MQNYLLDTCAWYDLFTNPSLLNSDVRNRIKKQHTLVLSTISVLEVTRKYSLKKLHLNLPFDEWLARATPEENVIFEQLSPEVAIESYQLPGDFHNDPADRVIVATARVHDLTVITSDAKILNYPYVNSLKSR